MSTFDNVKETLTNKLDELRDDGRGDSVNQTSEDSSQERDLQDAPDEHTEVLNEAPEDDLIVNESPEDRLATDYDLVQNDAVQDETYDSGLDDFREDEELDEIRSDEGGPVIVDDSETLDYTDEDFDSQVVPEDAEKSNLVQNLDGEEERRLEQVDELYEDEGTGSNENPNRNFSI